MKSLLSPLALPVLIGLAACSSPQDSKQAPALSGDWTLDASASHLSFVTVKAGSVAEAHVFKTLSGSVGADGKAQIDIDLASAATGVDIRDERLRSILFETGTYPKATVTAQLDPAAYEGLGVGESMTVTVPATLNLHGMQGDVEAELAVTRAGDDKVTVSTVKPVIVDADSFGLDAGVEKLREIANLPAITHAVPVSFSITFTH